MLVEQDFSPLGGDVVIWMVAPEAALRLEHPAQSLVSMVSLVSSEALQKPCKKKTIEKLEKSPISYQQREKNVELHVVLLNILKNRLYLVHSSTIYSTIKIKEVL